MLISIIERFQEDCEQEVVHYAAWCAALQRFKGDCESGLLTEIPDLGKYLEFVPDSQHPETIQDLISAHLTQSWTQGSGLLLRDYITEFSELGPLEKLPTDLLEDEFLARHQLPHGDFPKPSDYLEQFPERKDLTRQLQRRFPDGQKRYVKLHRIGSGATSLVWSTFDHDQKKVVAIKEPLAEPEKHSDIHRLLKSEASITSSLEHPGIVTITEVDSGDSIAPFYVMGMAGEETFSDRIQAHHKKLERKEKSIRKRNDWEDLLKSVIKICDAMDYAHSQGILHCDLKPGNVVCNKAGEIGVIDWGMARKLTATDSHPTGTPEYMAPEQVDGIVDVRSEVFCLGALLYETLTGCPPFLWTKNGMEARPDNWQDLVRSGAFKPPRKVKRGVPGTLDSICRKTMAVNPEARFQSASALAEALQVYLSAKPSPLQFWKG